MNTNNKMKKAFTITYLSLMAYGCYTMLIRMK